MRSWSSRRRVVTLGGALVGLWVLFVVWQVGAATLALRSGADDLRAVRRQATVEGLLEPATAARLQAGEGRFAEAHDRTSGPLLAPLRILPVVGRHVRGVAQLADAGEAGTAAARSSLRRLEALADRPAGGGPERVAVLTELGELADDAAAALDAIDPGDGEGLVGPLGRAIEDVDDQREGAVDGARRLAATSRALASTFEGPSTYLLLGANNAEMRNGSGMFLSAAEVGFADGRLELGDVAPTAELVRPPGSVPVEGDLAENWGWLDPGSDLRQLGVTADFPQSAEVAARNWAATGEGREVDGVIVVDVDGLRSLLRVVGPVEVDGIVYGPDTVRGELLRRQYERFGDDRQARRDQVGAVATAVFERLEAGEYDLPVLATQLADAVSGRHLLVWSRDAALQEAWAEVGADGHLVDTSVSVGLLNRAATKLDSWIETDVDLSTARGIGGERRLTVTVEVRNTSQGVGTAYQVGPNVEGLDAGDHRALVVVNLPAGVRDVVVEGGRPFLEGGDGPTVVIGTEVTIPASSGLTVTVSASLPGDVASVVLEPTARIPRTGWTVEGRALDRDRRRTVTLGPG
jgi:hypothetical protein